MKKLMVIALVLGFALGGYVAGSWRAERRKTALDSHQPAGLVRYYVDPMNPAHRSDKPGLAPCGMQMEPVYAEAVALAGKSRGRTIMVNAEKQQLFGIATCPVQKKEVQHTLRLFGTVSLDETRVYRVNAAVSGWITKAFPYATGSEIKKDEILASFYSPEFLAAAQALLFAANAKERSQTAAKTLPFRTNQVFEANFNVQQYADTLQNLGMGQPQIDELMRTRTFMKSVDIVSPADGFITARNISDGARFEKGTELYRIADLRQVWILVDTFEKDVRGLKPGAEARVRLPGEQESFAARLSQSLPQYDGQSRTLKLRFEAENPDFVLKPEMPVDVEICMPPVEALVVPAEAVLDSGLQKTVFVECGNGLFEQRRIETGKRFGDAVQVCSALKAGERVVVSGNFLLDSETRIKFGGEHQEILAKDPVCGMEVAQRQAKSSVIPLSFRGATYYFCSESCAQRFEKNPGQFVSAIASAKQ